MAAWRGAFECITGVILFISMRHAPARVAPLVGQCFEIHSQRDSLGAAVDSYDEEFGVLFQASVDFTHSPHDNASPGTSNTQRFCLGLQPHPIFRRVR